MMKKFIVGVISCLCLSGCATSGQVGKLPAITDPGNAGKTIIIRNYNFFGAAVEYAVLLDGRKINTLSTKEYTVFDLNRGEHILGVECPNGWGGTKTISRKVTINGNDVFYFLLSPSGNGCEIESIDKSEGEDRRASSHLVPAMTEERVSAPPSPAKEKSALDILKERYANGEINKEQYEKMKQDIGE